jgi:hypothetical protein
LLSRGGSKGTALLSEFLISPFTWRLIIPATTFAHLIFFDLSFSAQHFCKPNCTAYNVISFLLSKTYAESTHISKAAAPFWKTEFEDLRSIYHQSSISFISGLCQNLLCLCDFRNRGHTTTKIALATTLRMTALWSNRSSMGAQAQKFSCFAILKDLASFIVMMAQFFFLCRSQSLYSRLLLFLKCFIRKFGR